MNGIPVHKLRDRTKQGFLLVPFSPKETGNKESERLGPHRDDHYIFFVLLKGTGSTVVDFDKKTIHANHLYFILPEQIHYRIRGSKAAGWFIAADPALIDPACRNAFESWLGFQAPVSLTTSDANFYDQLLTILYSKMNEPQGGVSMAVLHSLLRAFFEMAANTVRVSKDEDVGGPRSTELALKFKRLLGENILRYKRPSDYADMLHISESYLNDCLKKVTGSPVSFWIRYKIIIEAKRLLYFSDLNVKQIADALGFEDHNYFSRLFRKETGMSALAFRMSSRVQ